MRHKDFNLEGTLDSMQYVGSHTPKSKHTLHTMDGVVQVGNGYG